MNKALMFAFALFGLVCFATATVPTCPEKDPSTPLYFEDDEDCASFCECSNGDALHFNCPPGTYFKLSVGCAWADTVNCGNTTPVLF